MYRATRWRWTPWKKLIIQMIINRYKVDMTIAEQADANAYGNFNEFFTRSIKASERPVDSDPLSIVSPVDGSISQIGNIDKEVLLQAKAKHFSLRALLANDMDAVDHFTNGSFSTLYLSPRDYHRIHIPLDARLVKMTYVPGDLFSVNESTNRAVDQLYARNERLICLFESPLGLMATILVGAIFVGGMETVWEGEITPALSRELRHWHYDSRANVKLDYLKGEEIARFNMGSTVILLFEQNRMNWSETLHAGDKVQMGKKIGTGNS
jgi:phosphatidylserine decarboxylase